MKSIYLIRHAKSDSQNRNVVDIDRVLNREGIEDAHLLGEKLNELGFNPDLIVCSSAQRAIETNKIIFHQTDSIYTNTIFDSSIYNATIDYLIFLVNTLPNKCNEVAIVGHNPSITMLSNYLTADTIDHIPTCGIVKIELEIDDWNEITNGIGSKKYFISPKSFASLH